MIYLLFTFAGFLLLIAGLYAMSFGFSTPPNFLLFLVGLCSFVLGVMLVILFATKIDLDSLKSSKPKSSKVESSKPKTQVAPVNERAPIKKSTAKIKSTIEPKKVEPRSKRPMRPVKPSIAPVKKDEIKAPAKMEEVKEEPVKSAKKPKKFLKLPKFRKKDQEEKISEPSNKISKGKTPAKPVIAQDDVKAEAPNVEETPEVPKMPPKRTPRRPLMNKLKEEQKAKPAEKIEKPKEEIKKEPVASESKKEPKEIPMEPMKPIKPVKKMDKSDTHYVKERLNKLKQEYIENVDDVEDLIEERLDSFRGALNKIRSESMEPSIIWSFDATDVQEAMKETILKADEKVIIMYPWIRNIDVGILKKFMDTDSKMIIQEASLDDDASVELIKVLLDNGVQIKTMPHIHTVAVVSDDTHGLIISTDPIYESFEVGVIYKDERSINEIEKLFTEAWNLSNGIDMGAS